MSIADIPVGPESAMADGGAPYVDDWRPEHHAAGVGSTSVLEDPAEDPAAGPAEPATGEAIAAEPEQFVMPADAPTHPPYPIGHRGDIDPAALVVGPNRRKTVVLAAEFVSSIKARGVLRRIHVYQDPAGHLLIADGQRRTLGAIKARRESVPFEVVEEPADAAHLIYDQLGLNDHERMTTRDVVESFRQLSLLGETPTKMARESGRKTKDVKGMLAVAGSTAAQTAGDEVSFEELVVIAEFDGDPEAQRRLVEGLRWGRFTHVAQQLRDERADREAKQKILDDAAAQGIPVIEGAGYDHTAQPLSRLGLDGDDVAEEHRKSCAGHAVVVTTEWSGTGRIWVAKPVCQDPVANGHPLPDWIKREIESTSAPKKVADMDPEEADRVRAERKLVRENNLAWQSAVVVRREWLGTQLAKRTAVPSGAELFIVGELLRNPHYLHDGLSDGLAPLAQALLPAGTKLPLTHGELAEHLIEKITTGKRGVVLAAVVVLYAWENSHGGDDVAKGTWRRFTGDDTRVLLQMEKWGYQLSDVERLVAHPKPVKKARAPRRPAATAGTTATAVTSEATDLVAGSVDETVVDGTVETGQATDAESVGAAVDVVVAGATKSGFDITEDPADDAPDGRIPSPTPEETGTDLGASEAAA